MSRGWARGAARAYDLGDGTPLPERGLELAGGTGRALPGTGTVGSARGFTRDTHRPAETVPPAECKAFHPNAHKCRFVLK